MKNRNHLIPWILGLCALVLFAALAVKSYSDVFASGDSADFLAAATTWEVTHTYGYPLYVVLGQFLNILPGSLVVKMTVGLSALPAAVTVAFVYLIVLHLTKRRWLALVSGLVLVGTAVFLTEATITKGYALTAMLLTAAYYCYLRQWTYRVVICLGLATAVHMLVVAVAFLWILADRRWSLWLRKPLLVYIACGILPYGLVPLLMALDTPRFLAGPLNWENLVAYFSTASRAIIGTLSIFDVPSRWALLAQILLLSIGVGLIPLLNWKAYKPFQRYHAVLLACPLFVLWYVATCMDVMVWPYLAMGAPFVAVMVGLGLSKMHKSHSYVVVAGAVILMAVNGVFLNADALTNQNPRMVRYYDGLRSLPANSMVVAIAGQYSLGAFYANANGIEVAPIIFPYLESTDTEAMAMLGYDGYLYKRYGVLAGDTLQTVQWGLDNNRTVYFVPTEASRLLPCFILEEPVVYGQLNRIVGLTGEPPASALLEASK